MCETQLTLHKAIITATLYDFLHPILVQSSKLELFHCDHAQKNHIILKK